MPLTASARRIDGLRHEVLIDGRHLLVTDEPCHLGGTDTGPAPHELLPASLAACIATTVELYAARKGWDVGDVVVDVVYEHQADPRHFDVTVRLPDDLEPDQLERLERVAASCPVHRSLEAGFSFEQRLIGEPRATRK
jgi:putative redox protein